MKEFGALCPESNQTSESAIKEIKALLDQKADVNSRNPQADTFLITAALRQDLKMAKLLIQKGADVNRKAPKMA
jgi:ankyrin repeat protein